MRRLFLSIIMALSLAASAQTILSTLPASSGEMPTMAQLTPGNPDFLYASSLLNVRFDDEGHFRYVLPSELETAAPQSHAPRGAVSADGLWTALNEGDRLWLQSLGEDSVRLQVSDPEAASDSPDMGQSPIVWGQSVHRNEFGIDGGLFWSPDGHRLAFYRMDQSMVGQYPLLQTDPREAEVRWIRYPMAGMTSHQVTVGIYDPDTQRTIYLRTNDKPVNTVDHGLNAPDHYLCSVTWTPDCSQILVAELNRLQNYMEMNVYDASTGVFLRTLFSESAARYVEPKATAVFLPGSNSRFVWLSERNGYLQAYLYDIKPSSVDCCCLTHGSYDITDIVGIDPGGKYLYFMAAYGDSPLESNLYSVALPKASSREARGAIAIKAEQVVRITTATGRHRVMVNPQYTQVYDTYTAHDVPRRCQLITLKNGKPIKTEVLYDAPNPYAACDEHPALARPAVEVGTLKAADGVTDLYYRLVKPADDGARHPVVVYLYNGPHAQLVTEGYQWGLPGWDCYMALRGYVVFTIDGRGSDCRGLDFEQAIWHNLGAVEAADQMQGVAYLKTLPYVDADRIGIYGWSYGGFMTTYMKLNYPETFKVGVCGGPVLDWSRYEVMYGERYMGTPQDNPDGYRANTMIDQTDKLQGHLLIIHDDQDGTVVPQMSMQFLKNAVATGTYPDFLMYMNHEHNVRGRDRIHLLNNIARYFDEHL